VTRVGRRRVAVGDGTKWEISDLKCVASIVGGNGIARWDDLELAVAGVGRSDDSVSRSELVVAFHV
jgi:hypothetical protein